MAARGVLERLVPAAEQQFHDRDVGNGVKRRDFDAAVRDRSPPVAARTRAPPRSGPGARTTSTRANCRLARWRAGHSGRSSRAASAIAASISVDGREARSLRGGEDQRVEAALIVAELAVQHGGARCGVVTFAPEANTGRAWRSCARNAPPVARASWRRRAGAMAGSARGPPPSGTRTTTRCTKHRPAPRPVPGCRCPHPTTRAPRAGCRARPRRPGSFRSRATASSSSLVRFQQCKDRFRVAAQGRPRLARFRKALEPVRARRFQHPVARNRIAFGQHQRLVDQRAKMVERRSTDRCAASLATCWAASSVKPPANTRQSPEHGLLVGGEQRVAPLERRAQRLMAAQHDARPAGEEVETLVQASAQSLDAQQREAARRRARSRAECRRGAGRFRSPPADSPRSMRSADRRPAHALRTARRRRIARAVCRVGGR